MQLHPSADQPSSRHLATQLTVVMLRMFTKPWPKVANGGKGLELVLTPMIWFIDVYCN